MVAVALASAHEGIKFTPYYDPPGILTVCRGHTGNVENRRYTLAECDALMDKDMRWAVDSVEKCIPGMPEPVLAAFADAVYNIGPKIACDKKNSTAARLLAERRYDEACRQLPRWNKVRIAGQAIELRGLTKRRNEEMVICLGDQA